MGSAGRPKYLLYKTLWTGLDWLYPPQCGGCGTSGSRWCAVCTASVVPIASPICSHCGEPAQVATQACSRCQARKPTYTALRSWAPFNGPVQNALHRLKYRRDLGLGEVLARPLAGILAEQGWEIDLVVPMPLGRERLAERGYNQVALLALPMALMTGLEYRTNVLVRARETASQVGLSATQRHANVAGAFQTQGELIKDRRVLLVDDVMTTGATMESAAQAVLEGGARQVFGLTLARAVLKGEVN